MSIRTLTDLEKHWPFFDFSRHGFSTIEPAEKLTVNQSRSGAGMVLLGGFEVKVYDAWVSAHLSFPSDKTGVGTFTEGHLKIETGRYLNQYFFSCDDNDRWEVEKLSNSLTAKTAKPGKWDQLGANLWKDIDKLVTHLAYL